MPSHLDRSSASRRDVLPKRADLHSKLSLYFITQYRNESFYCQTCSSSVVRQWPESGPGRAYMYPMINHQSALRDLAWGIDLLQHERRAMLLVPHSPVRKAGRTDASRWLISKSNATCLFKHFSMSPSSPERAMVFYISLLRCALELEQPLRLDSP